MAQDIVINGAEYPDVPAINVSKAGGGTATFVDETMAVMYEEQTGKTEAQKAQARTNIGAAEAALEQLMPYTTPTAGKMLKVLSVNDDGTFTCEWAESSGGGLRKLIDVTLEEDVTGWNSAVDMNNNPISCREMKIIVIGDATANCNAYLYFAPGTSCYALINKNAGFNGLIEAHYSLDENVMRKTYSANTWQSTYYVQPHSTSVEALTYAKIANFDGAYFKAGTRIIVLGK